MVGFGYSGAFGGTVFTFDEGMQHSRSRQQESNGAQFPLDLRPEQVKTVMPHIKQLILCRLYPLPLQHVRQAISSPRLHMCSALEGYTWLWTINP